ncbi:MAG: ATP-binding protein [Acidobacteriota bacterium]
MPEESISSAVGAGDTDLDTLLRRVAKACALSACIIAFAVLAAWAAGHWSLTAFGEGYIPMAPSTAILFVMLSSAMCLPDSRSATASVWRSLAVSLAVLASAAVVAQYLLGLEFASFEHWLGNTKVAVGGFEIGRMSPLTALAFLATAAAFQLARPPLVRKRLVPYAAAGLAGMVLLLAVFVVLGYATGEPILYAGRTTPMALITGVSFGLVALGILANTLQAMGLAEHAAADRVAGTESQRRFGTRLVGIFILSLIALGGSAFSYLRKQQVAVRRGTQDELEAVANLKMSQIVSWREERLADARFFARAEFVARDVQAFLADPSSSAARDAIIGWLTLLKAGDRYERVALFDSKLAVRVSVPPWDPPPGPTATSFVAEALRSTDPVMTDLHRGDSPDEVHVDLLFPVFPLDRLRVSPDFDVSKLGLPLGVVMLRIDPRRFLFPLIQSWPGPSPTAETLLVRREGNQVVFLTELRHSGSSALSMRFPVDAPRLPAAMALQGKTGVTEGLDYRGVPVTAAMRPVRETPWYIVAKVDADEVYAPLYAQAWTTGVIAVVLVLVLTSGVGLVWQQRESLFLRRELAAERARLRAEEALGEERRRVEEQIRRLNAELEQRVVERTAQLEAANKELEAFSYSISHDLRAPLRHLDGFSRILVEEHAAELPADAARYLGIIRQSAQQMGRLIDELLHFSRLSRQPLARQDSDMQEMVQQVWDDLRGERQERGVEIGIEPLPAAECDPGLIRQVWTNLLSNALKFTRRCEVARIEVGWRAPESSAAGAYFVRDNGAGFDMRYADKLFGVFQRLHRAEDYEGTGVGLAIVQRIIHRHGGRVWAESEPGKGATFYFSIEGGAADG